MAAWSTTARRSVDEIVKAGAPVAKDLKDLVGSSAPRAVWIMLPAGGPTEETVKRSRGLLQGDTVIDGGNSFYRDDIRRAKKLAERACTMSTSASPAASGGWSAATA